MAEMDVVTAEIEAAAERHASGGAKRNASLLTQS